MILFSLLADMKSHFCSETIRAEQALLLRVFVNYRGMSYARFVRIPSCYLHRLGADMRACDGSLRPTVPVSSHLQAQNCQ